MKNLFRTAVVVAIVLTVPAFRALGQASGSFDPQKYEDRARDLLQQMQKPDFDQDQFRQQMQDLMQQFRDETASMTPDQIDQIRQKMMEHLQPAIQQAMPAIMRRMQQGMLDRLKTQLECTDEEFAALKPGLQKLLDALQTVNLAGRRGFGGGAPPPLATKSPLAQAMADLHEALADPEAKADVIKSKLEKVRAAKEQANHDLAVAQAELRPLLTVRQESILVNNGLLD